MPTQTKENYLKAIYFLQLKNQEVSITELGKVMDVSKPTVNNMIKKLTNIGWVKYIKYKPITLTSKGKKQAALIVRKHRLTEMFLEKIMGFGWEEVHSIAEEMEHLKTEKLFDRMDELLGYPTTDPHGSPIPNKDGLANREHYKIMSSYKVGDSLQLRAVGDSSVELLKFLNEKEIKLGTLFFIAKIESFDKTMIVDYGKYKRVAMSYEVCKRLLVEEM